jgi:hypothetical protein
MTCYEMRHPIKIRSLPLFDLRKPKTKSMKISTRDVLGTSKVVYKPCGKTLDLAFLHVMHLSHTPCTSQFILGQ